METNWVQQLKPVAARSAPCFATNPANSVRGKCCEQLIEQARHLYHDLALLGNVCGEVPAKGSIRSRLIIKGLFIYPRSVSPVWERSDI